MFPPAVWLFQQSLASRKDDKAEYSVLHVQHVTQNWSVSLEKQLGHVRNDGHYVIATVLDPRFKMKWISGGATEEATVKSLLAYSIDKEQASLLMVLV